MRETLGTAFKFVIQHVYWTEDNRYSNIIYLYHIKLFALNTDILHILMNYFL